MSRMSLTMTIGKDGSEDDPDCKQDADEEQSDGLVELEDEFILSNCIFHEDMRFPLVKAPFHGNNGDDMAHSNEPTHSIGDSV